ncbi:exosome complex component RRP43-like isoform X2 [Prorops nasuta]|uniref:exosome complex component RRP43-like isoform X2 n=1 Tax=Prorops nasuta TaxID=863751 RepID=UPI0034CE41F0
MFKANNIRPDGRQFISFRPLRVNVSSIIKADASAIFKIGNTTVVCGIKAELAVPKPETPGQGYLIPNVEFSPLCSPKFRPGPPSEKAQVATTLINNILLNSKAIKLENLCICKDKLVWALYCDLLCINYDGSVLDACMGALTAALKTLTLPKVDYKIETGGSIVYPHNRLPFPFEACPVSISFALFENQLLVVDPTDEEESLALATLVVVTNKDNICCIHKPGGLSISHNLLFNVLAISKQRAQQVRSMIETAVCSAETNEQA